MGDDKIKKVTFFSKKANQCPICGTRFYKEELFSGGGRLLAGNLTHDLRRLYEPSKKYGLLYPLIYYVLVCPTCWFAAFPGDFTGLTKESKTMIDSESNKRRDNIYLLFKKVDFKENRNLTAGVASYILAIMSYDHMDKKASPTIKMGVAALRCAWLFSDLHAKFPGENYDYLSKLFYRKASFLYSLAVEREQTGEELLSGIKNLGPDLDKNYGYDGMLYLTGYLAFNYGPKKDIAKRYEKLEGIKRIIAKMHGIGKASKNRPSIILTKAKDLYDDIGNEIQELKKELE